MKKVGEFVVKGLCYKDIVSILSNNGYAVEVFTPSRTEQEPFMPVTEFKHRIKIYEVEESEE